MTTVNASQVTKIARTFQVLPVSGDGLNFYSYGSGKNEVVAVDMYPPLHHPSTIDFFFFVCLHQYGFWHGDVDGYDRPLFGRLDGKSYKGSDLLWRIARRALEREPAIFQPEQLAHIAPEKLFGNLFVDDNGPIPFPDLEQRRILTQAYGRSLTQGSLTPSDLVNSANAAPRPLASFLKVLSGIPGFAEDSLQKKALLLAMTLVNRPEGYLKVTDSYSWKPIVDYHLMRVALRLGLIDLTPSQLNANRQRHWVSGADEMKIRQAAYRATERLIAESGRPMSCIDEQLWLARHYCPETDKPDCDRCPFAQSCKRRIDLFQPIFRTTNY